MICKDYLLLFMIVAISIYQVYCSSADTCKRIQDQYKCDCDPGMEHISCSSTSASGELVVPEDTHFYELIIQNSNFQSIDLKNMGKNESNHIVIIGNKELRQVKNFPKTAAAFEMHQNPKLVVTMPKIQSGKLETIYAQENGKVTLGENVFSGLFKLQSVIMLNDSITDQDIKDSLLFDSDNEMYVVMHNNPITSAGLKNSKLSKNTKHVLVEFVGCNIKDLDEANFGEIAANSNVNLILHNNPIECTYKSVAWLLSKKTTLQERFRDVYCSNYKNRELWSMSPGDFTDGPITTKVY